MPISQGARSIELVYPGQAMVPQGWYVSHWNVGQSRVLSWSTDNVRYTSTGNVELELSPAPLGSERAFVSGEVQSIASASTGTWSWTAQVPELVSGSVFGMFAYRADHFNDPWIEFDFEFLGRDGGDFDGDGDIDIHHVRLNIYMQTAFGDVITLEQTNGWQPVIVDLGFDATEGFHTYEMVVTGSEAVFVVDGAVIGRFGGSDMLYGTWTTGEMKGFANLWCVDPSLENWAGEWAYSGKPIVGTLSSMEVRPGELGGFGALPSNLTLNGTKRSDDLIGQNGHDMIYGHEGNDVLSGNRGHDRLYGGEGKDTLFGGAGSDILNGGGGQDMLYGGAGDGLRDVFVFTSTSDSAQGKQCDKIHDFVSGIDLIDLSGIDANTRATAAGDQAFLFSYTTAQAHSVWYTKSGSDLTLRGDVNGDKTADFEIRLADLSALAIGDLVL